MSILEQIVEKYPIRRSAEQKEAFSKWAIERMTELGYRARVEESDKGKHRNIVAGNPDKAKVVFTAHYDTPACIGIPNLMIPRNFPVYLLYQIAVVGGMLAIALGLGIGLGALLKSQQAMLLGYFGVYMVLLMLMLYGPANKHNVNDNTSGVTAILELMARIPEEKRQQVAFILFDNEEKGCKGSKAYARDHLQVQHMTLIVNLDCVGVGEHFILSVPKLAKNMEEYQLLERVLASHKGRTVHFFSAATTRGNSDFRSFKCGVGMSAYEQKPGVGFVTGKIHTGRDTVADQGNLDFIAGALADCVMQLPEAEEG